MSLAEESRLRIDLREADALEAPTARDRYALISSLLERGFSVSRGVSSTHPTPDLAVGWWQDTPESGPLLGDAVLEIAGRSPAEVVGQVEAYARQSGAADPGAWNPWFPVIDYDRCTNCMQCLSFCLFAVYDVSADQRIQVKNPENCKTNCPACARVCPEAAIMFPKYKAGPINGDPVNRNDPDREALKVDVSALLGGDVHSLLRGRTERARSRFSPERDADQALRERQKCLAKLRQSIDIPPEVMLSLPSPEEMQKRASDAAARAQAARAGRDTPNQEPKH